MTLIKHIKTDTMMFTYENEQEQEAHIVEMRKKGYKVDYDWVYYNLKPVNMIIYEKAEIHQG